MASNKLAQRTLRTGTASGRRGVLERVRAGWGRFRRGRRHDCLDEAVASICEALERRAMFASHPTFVSDFDGSTPDTQWVAPPGQSPSTVSDEHFKYIPSGHDVPGDHTTADYADGYKGADNGSSISTTLTGADLIGISSGQYTFSADLLLIDIGDPTQGHYTITIDATGADGKSHTTSKTVQLADETLVAASGDGVDADREWALDNNGNPFPCWFSAPDYSLGVSLEFDNVSDTKSVMITVTVGGLDNASAPAWPYGADQDPPQAKWGMDLTTDTGTTRQKPCPCDGQEKKHGVYLPTGKVDPVARGVGTDAAGYPLAADVSWGNEPVFNLGDHPNGNNVLSSLTPFLIENGGNQVIAVTNHQDYYSYFVFDDLGEGSTWDEAFELGTNVHHDADNHRFTVTQSDGSRAVYYDFSAANDVHLRGKMDGVVRVATNAAGDHGITLYNYDAAHDDRLSSIDLDVTTGGITAQQRFDYAYVASGDGVGKISSVTLSRLSGGSYVPWKKTLYSYYASDDLKAVQNADSAGNVIDTTYYGYYTGSGTNGYAGALKFVVGPRAYSRLVGAGQDPLTSSVSDATLAQYADDYYEYDPSTQQVSKLVLGGDEDTDRGTHTFTYLVSGDTNSVSVSDGSWVRRTQDTRSDGTVERTYFDAANKLLLDEVIDTTGNRSGTYYLRDAAERVVAVYNPSALQLPDQTELESHRDLLNVHDGRSPYVKTNAGRIDFTTYETSEGDAEDSGLAGYVSETAVGRGQLWAPVTISGISGGPLTYTVTTAADHGYANGDSVTIDGSLNSAFNGTYVISSVTHDTFVITFTSSPGTPSIDAGTTASEPQARSKTETWTYTTHSTAASNGGSIEVVATDTLYRNQDGTGGETTSYDYDWYDDSLQPMSITMTLPTISSGQNGPGVADQQTIFFDVYGRRTWAKDGDGYLSYTGYDRMTGAVSKTILDVRTSAFSTGLPFGWSSSTNAADLVTSYLVDGDGRVVKVTDPNGNNTFITYNDILHERRIYPGWRGTNGTTGPVVIQREFRPTSAGSNNSAVYFETIMATVRPHSGDPTGSEDFWSGGTVGGSVHSLTRDVTDASGMVVESDRYFTLASTSYSTAMTRLGTLNTNYYATTYGYDSLGRQNRVVNPLGTITRTVYDALGRVTSTWVGTNDTPSSGAWSPTNSAGMTDVVDNYYDAHDGTQGIGDGNLTRTVAHPSTNAADARVTETYYDWRDRPVATKVGVNLSSGAVNAAGEDTTTKRLIAYKTYDNLDEVIQGDTYAGDQVGITTTDGVPDAPGTNLLRARVTYGYDDQGRVYRTDRYNVVQSGSDAGDPGTYTLSSQTWYDHRGNVMASAAPGGLVSKYVYDGAGRVIRQYDTDGGQVNAPSTWGNWTNAASVSNDIVLEQTDYTFDANSNVIATATRQRFNDDATNGAGLGALGDPSTGPKARVYYNAFYYDAADRLTDSVDVGTNGTNGAYTRPSTAPTNSTATLHLTHTDYNDAGLTSVVTDAKGHKTLSLYDLLGRPTRSVSGWDGNTNALSINVSGSVFAGANFNQTTDYAYDGDDHVILQTAWNKSGTNAATFQKTQYNYGISTSAGSAVNSNDVLASVQYPDKATGNPGSGTAYAEVFTYNAAGDRTGYTDRNGTVHAYGYDALGRPISDAVTHFGDGIYWLDVQALGTQYDDAGRVYQQTSYDGTNLATANVLNQERYAYNGLGQLTKDTQGLGGSVTTNSASVQYAYDEMSGGANESRLSTETYPNSRVVHDGYNSGLDSAISRLSFIADDNGSGSVGTHLEEYKYLGLGTIVERTRPEPGTRLTLIRQSGDTLAGSDGGDQYVGLDRFGRIADQNWINYSGTSVTGTTDRFQYGYDANSNVLYKDNKVNSSFSELYHANSASAGDNAGAYDALDRLTGFSRGTLSASGNNGSGLDTVSAPNTNVAGVSGSQLWNLDAQGNWSTITTDGTATTRSTDGQNELTGTATGTNTSSFTYDNNGNMTADGQGHTYAYDAWNRLVEFQNATDDVQYEYYANGRMYGSSDNNGITIPTTLYYNDAAGRVVQENNNGISQYVYGTGYVNDLILRDRNADHNATTGTYGKKATSGTNATGLEERLYAQQDANFNVTSLTDATGVVKQRFVYDAYGQDAALNGDWTAAGTNAAAVSMDVKYQGMRQDRASSLYVTANREYSTSLGRWIEQDPTGYIDGANLNQLTASNPIRWVDPTGTSLTVGGVPMDEDNSYYRVQSQDPVKKEVLDKYMYDSREFTFDQGEFDTELDWRSNTVKAAMQMAENREGIGFPSQRAPHPKASYSGQSFEPWMRSGKNQHGVQQKEGTSASEALKEFWNALVHGEKEVSIECQTAVETAWLKGFADTLGEAFDSYMKKYGLRLTIGDDTTIPPFGGRRKQPLNLPGDTVYFKNPGVEGAWQGENALQLTDGMFYAHPFGIVSADDIIKRLNGIEGATGAYQEPERGVPLFGNMEGERKK